MKAYLQLCEKILNEGELKHNRTGIDTISIPGYMFEHDMKDGFPLLTTKKMSYKNIFSELEFFIKGLHNKKWLQERKNHIWDEWCDQRLVPYGNDEESKQKMKNEDELGPIYGVQWRNFNGVDQLKNLVDKLHTNPDDRRMIVSAWNPGDIPHMALPPCHWGFQVIVTNNKLNLLWNQRSVDTALGLPYNIASYACLLHLLAREGKFAEGKLIGFLGDTHFYINQIDGIKEQLNREPYELPSIEEYNFTSIFNWVYTDSTIVGYKHYEGIHFDIAI
jgi:thymidylate synthase